MNNIMENILKNKLEGIDDLFLEIRKFLDENEIDELIEIINNIKQNKLYYSQIHGLYHSEKVLLFSYIIAKKMKLDPVSFQILVDAALYHDIKRQNDYEDSCHGLASALEIKNVVDSEIYSDKKNLDMLKAIVDIHSQDDKKERINFENYELDEEMYDKYKILYSILKDADALDRKRFSEKAMASLNPEFLRIEFSKELINLSTLINETYYDVIYKNQQKHVVDVSKSGTCFHSVSFDFFKLKSILTYGILSSSEIKNRHLNVPRNFEGGNGNDWISVVDAALIMFQHTGYENFTKHGISFYCEVPEMIMPLSDSQRSEAIQKGLPFDKSGHLDEKYVYGEIPVENILCAIVPHEYVEIDIRNLTYLYNSLDFNLFVSRINYYVEIFAKNGISIFDDNNYNKETFEKLLIEYKKEIDLFIVSERSAKDKHETEIKLTSVLFELNKYIQNAMYKYYAKIFNTAGHINVLDVVKHELSQSNINYNYIGENEEAMFIFDHNEKSKGRR